MRFAIFSDIHANLEALEAVLAKIDELAQEEPIDQIWFLGDLVGYGPNPNECMLKLRERTNVIIAGNHDWAAVGKIDLEDFSAAARISAEWTAEQLTEEHRTFLANLPERLELGECTLVHGSPYGPLWEYLTSEILSERSFQYFSSRYCFVGHTHVPVIFQQPDSIANTPTIPLTRNEPDTPSTPSPSQSNGVEHHPVEDDEETAEMVAVHPPVQQSTLSAKTTGSALSAFKDPESGQTATEDEANEILEKEQMQTPGDTPVVVEGVTVAEVEDTLNPATEDITSSEQESVSTAGSIAAEEQETATFEDTVSVEANTSSLVEADTPAQDVVDASTLEDTGIEATFVEEQANIEDASIEEMGITQQAETLYDEEITEEIDAPGDEDATQILETSFEAEQPGVDDYTNTTGDAEYSDETTPEFITTGTDDQLNSEIEELLTLLGLSQSMIHVTNEMITPPEGHWEAPEGYRAIINPGGVGQPRDGDPRAAFMIYDTERGFEFYRVPYAIEKTQEKIIKAGLPHYLAIRLAYGR
jgi:diadenosine tetraphosphatase ApaH/serine/threonine PP2A family protein phosphatase